MATVDLTPFRFTATESVVYSALLRLGPATGYGVGRVTRLARANAYAALEGLVSRGAAQRAAGRPARYRPADPGALLARLTAELWRPTLPAWRRAATRAAIDVRLAGESAETEGIVKGTVAAATPTVLLIDDSQLLTAAGAGEQITALWSSHPLLITLAQVALRNLA